MFDATARLKELVEKRKSSLIKKIDKKETKPTNKNIDKEKKQVVDESIEILKKAVGEKEILNNQNDKKVEVKEFDESRFDDIESFLSKENKFNSYIEKNLSDIKNNTIIHCDAKNNKDFILAIIKKSLKEKKTPVLILTSNNYKSFSRYLINSKISLNDLYIIDTVSKSLINVNDFDKVLLVDSLRNITQLQIKLLKILRKNKDYVVIFDTLDVLELYHPEKIILKFTYSMVKLISKNLSHSVMIINSNKLAPKLAQFFNDFLKLKKID